MSSRREVKFAVLLSAFSSAAERFLSSGYKGELSLEEQLEKVANIKEISGIELDYPSDFSDAKYLKSLVNKFDLNVALIEVDLFGDPKWKYGSISSRNEKLRAESVELCKQGMDVAVELGCNQITLWPAQDGFDYPMQTDYQASWRNTRASLEEIVAYREDVKVCIEYKIKEPRTHMQLGTVGKVLSLVNAIGAKNLGVLVDLGHSLIAYENPAESAVLLNEYNRLFYVHFNDNFRLWDDDLVPGTVHLWETVEFLYWLNRIGYKEWYSLDIFPYREDSEAACRQSIRNLMSLMSVAEKLDEEKLRHLQHNNDAMGMSELLRQTLFD